MDLEISQTCEAAGARSTRIVIDSATTPSTSPPNELRHIFSPYDTHHQIPDVAALTDADHKLQQHQSGQQAEQIVAQMKVGEEVVPQSQSQSQDRQHIIPPYMLKAISISEEAGSRSRASAKQTLDLLPPKPLKDNNNPPQEASDRK